jgi:hypothetical protein
LVESKVKFLSAMIGQFKTGGPEFNIMLDTLSAQRLFREWPTPIVASGGEVGGAMLFPGESIKRDYSYVQHHPIVDSYLVYCEERKSALAQDGWLKEDCPHNHPTPDLTATLYAAYPERGYFNLSEPGEITISGEGLTHFKAMPWGPHRYLVLAPSQEARTLEAMVKLASQPPRCVPTQSCKQH